MAVNKRTIIKKSSSKDVPSAYVPETPYILGAGKVSERRIIQIQASLIDDAADPLVALANVKTQLESYFDATLVPGDFGLDIVTYSFNVNIIVNKITRTRDQENDFLTGVEIDEFETIIEYEII